MANFCKQCSIEIFGQDAGDVAGISAEADTQAGLFAGVLCEECGLIQVDHEGRCVTLECLKRHGIEYWRDRK